MKKLLYIVTPVLVIVLIIGMLGYSGYIYEIPSRFAKHHNIINISVKDNENTLDVENIEISYSSENNSLVDTQNISNKQVKFKKGMYGNNTFNFIIPNETIGEFKVEFGQFNTNWWHVCNYNVKVVIFDIDEKSVEAKLKVDVTVEGNKHIYENTKILTKVDSTISSFR